jgi:hypothetical protein
MKGRRRRPLAASVDELAGAAFVARLLMGAQTEHEQRLSAARLLRRDDQLRAEVAAVLEPFEPFDADLAAEYGRALRDAGADVAARHREILERAFARAPDLDHVLRHFTYTDILGLRAVLGRFLTWSMAELLLERARRPNLSAYEVRVSLYLAQMVIDAVEILGAAGKTPEVPEVVADVRRRITEAVTAAEPGNRSGGRPE